MRSASHKFSGYQYHRLLFKRESAVIVRKREDDNNKAGRGYMHVSNQYRDITVTVFSKWYRHGIVENMKTFGQHHVAVRTELNAAERSTPTPKNRPKTIWVTAPTTCRQCLVHKIPF
jgi:hypothetical protein